MEQQTVQDIIAEMPIEQQERINSLPEGDARNRTMNAFQTIASMNNMLISKGTITLTVEVKTIKGANQINDWFYSSDKPMDAELTGMSWDQTLISKDVAEKISELRELFNKGL